MDLAKSYQDVEGNDCTICQMVRREPDWAANRIQAGEVAIAEVEKLKVMVDRAHGALNELLAGHLNIASEAAKIAKRGIWGDGA